MAILIKTGHDEINVAPTDLNQSIFRVTLVFIILVWTYFGFDGHPEEILKQSPAFQFTLVYFLGSIGLFLWIYMVVQKSAFGVLALRVTRIASVFADITALSIYTAISGESGIILYPIYLTSCIGYGYRFGIRYLFLALTLSALGFTFAQYQNEFIAKSNSVLTALYIGILVVPLYAANLLKQHRYVLERIQEVNAARSRFIANMSHELRTPLHAIINVADILAREGRANLNASSDSTNKLRLISDSGQHLLKLVNRILDIASAEASGTFTPQKEVVCLPAAILSALRICQPAAESKGIGFFWFFDLSLPLYIESSVEHIEEITINLVANAIKYTNSGHVHTSVAVKNEKDAAYLEIVVADTGIGISPQLLPTIFEPFTLGDDRASRRYSGTGLGLTLTKKLVENLGGQIKIESTENVGTTCFVLIPIEVPSSGVEHVLSKVSPTIDTVLVSPRDEEQLDLTLFTDSGWICRVVGNTNLSAINNAKSINVFFVDECMLDYSAVGSALKRRHPHALILSYCAQRCGVTQDTWTNACVVADCREDFYKAHFLARSAIAQQEPESGFKEILPVSGRRILVADDNSINLKTAQFALQSQGHEVTLVDSGDRALAELEKNHFDLAIIDLHMPDMSGIEVSQIYQFLFVNQRTPIIILTADATASSAHDATQSGAVAVLQKPLRAEELFAAVALHALDMQSVCNQYCEQPKICPSASNSDQLVDGSLIKEFGTLGVSRTEVHDLISEFHEESRELLNELEEAIALNQVLRTRNILHSLKGSCGAIGALRMKDLVRIAGAEFGQEVSFADVRIIDELKLTLQASVDRMRAEVDYI